MPNRNILLREELSLLRLMRSQTTHLSLHTHTQITNITRLLITTRPTLHPCPCHVESTKGHRADIIGPGRAGRNRTERPLSGAPINYSLLAINMSLNKLSLLNFITSTVSLQVPFKINDQHRVTGIGSALPHSRPLSNWTHDNNCNW